MALPQVQPHRFLTEEQRAKIKRAIAELRQLLPLYEHTRDPDCTPKLSSSPTCCPRRTVSRWSFSGTRNRWLRLIYRDGTLVPTTREWYEYARQQATQAELAAQSERQRAEAERQRAEQERQLREQAESQLERIRARLQAMGIDPDTLGE